MNSHGGLTLDFLFALVLVMSMTLLLGVFSFSLAVVESVQYVAFSSSRAYFPAHINPQMQKKKAQEKFDELTKSNGLSGFLKPSLFKVTVDRIGDASDIYKRLDNKDVLEGVRLKVDVEMLKIQIPGLSSSEDSSFETFVTSLIGRESTSEECQSFVDKRFTQLLNLSNYQSSVIQPDQYFAFDDNGC